MPCRRYLEWEGGRGGGGWGGRGGVGGVEVGENRAWLKELTLS